MALQASDFYADFPVHLFPLEEGDAWASPAEKRDARLAGWIAEADGSTDPTKRLYVEWKASRSIYRQMAGNPASWEASDGGRASYSADQRAAFDTAAKEAKADYAAALAAEAAAPVRVTPPSGSGIIRSGAVWA